MNARTSRRWTSAGDATIYAEPLGAAAARIDPDVLATLMRWREFDSYNSIELNAALGLLPHETTASGWDTLSGHEVHIKEGAHAAALVHEAIKHHPNVTRFRTDAQGIDGLQPERLATETHQSLAGLAALERAGVPQFPVLTALLATLHAWERIEEGRLDASTAIRTGAIDVGMQGLGIALGAKLAAVGIVALGAFPLAIVAIPAGAITGAVMLRRKVTERREAALDAALATFEAIRTAAESAARSFVELARAEMAAASDASLTALRTDLSALRTAWSLAVAETLEHTENDLIGLARRVEAGAEPAHRHAVGRVIADALAKSEQVTRLAALDAALELALPTVLSERLERLGVQLVRIRHDYRERCTALARRQAQMLDAARASNEREQQSFSLAAARAYMSALERAAQLRARVVAAFTAVDRELAKLNRGPLPLVTDA